MATESATTTHEYASPYPSILRGAGAGLVAGVVFGLLIQFVLGRMVAIGALYTLGTPSVTIGWVAHIGHSLLFGAVFGLLGLSNRLGPYFRDLLYGTVAGVVFGGVLWLVNIGFIWPVWLNTVQFGPGLPIPYFAPMPLVGHLVYGVGLGGGYALLSRYNR